MGMGGEKNKGFVLNSYSFLLSGFFALSVVARSELLECALVAVGYAQSGGVLTAKFPEEKDFSHATN